MGRGRSVRWSAAQSVAGCRAADGGAVGESRVVVQPWVTPAGRPRQQRWDGRRRRAAVSAMARTHSLHLLAYRVPVCARVCGSCGCRSEGRRRRGLAWPLRLSAPPAARDQGPPSRTIAHAHAPHFDHSPSLSSSLSLHSPKAAHRPVEPLTNRSQLPGLRHGFGGKSSPIRSRDTVYQMEFTT